MTADDALSPGQRAFLLATRRAVLVTLGADGRPRPVPICFVLSDDAPVLYTPIDEKPKDVADPRALARVRDIEADDRVSVLADRWDEDWSQLGWVRIEGRARLLDPADPGEPAPAEEHQAAVQALRAKYEQYAEHDLEGRPLIRIELDRTIEWGAIGLDTVYGG